MFPSESIFTEEDEKRILVKLLPSEIVSVILHPGYTWNYYEAHAHWEGEVLAFFFMDSDNSGHPKFENSRIWMLSSHVVIISSKFRQKENKNNNNKKTPPSNCCANMTTGGVLHKPQYRLHSSDSRMSDTARAGSDMRRIHGDQDITRENCTHKRIQ